MDEIITKLVSNLFLLCNTLCTNNLLILDENIINIYL